MSFQIEKGIPFPPLRAPRSMYPFGEMQVGDSFFVPGKTNNSISGVACGAAKRFGFKFAVRAMDGGVRVWRVA